MKRLTIRQLQRGFDKHIDALKPGQTIAVIKDGKLHVTITKPGPPRRRVRDWAAEVAKDPYPPEIGDLLVKKIHDDTVL